MESKKLDLLHHIAIEVKNIQESIDWYQKHFQCEILYQDATWGFLKFENIRLALVMPNQHPPHIAFEREDAEKFGVLKPHRDGTSSVYIEDPSGNAVEILKKITS